VGLFQFGYAARKATGYGHVTLNLMRDPITKKKLPYINIDTWPIEQQYLAMDSLLTINEDHLKCEIDVYEGKTISGIKITKSGILSAAHLAGPQGVKNFFNSHGTENPTDMNNTSVKTYLKLFSQYNI
jgi:hypothetical protein